MTGPWIFIGLSLTYCVHVSYEGIQNSFHFLFTRSNIVSIMEQQDLFVVPHSLQRAGESWGETECPLLTFLRKYKLLLSLFPGGDWKKCICQMSSYTPSARSFVDAVKMSSAQQLHLGLHLVKFTVVHYHLSWSIKTKSQISMKILKFALLFQIDLRKEWDGHCQSTLGNLAEHPPTSMVINWHCRIVVRENMNETY